LHRSLSHDETLGTLITAVAPLPPHAPTLRAYEAFKVDPTLYAIAVVDADARPMGLLNRFKFLETLSRPFAYDLFKHQTVAMAMDSAPLIVDEYMPLDRAVRWSTMARGISSMASSSRARVSIWASGPATA
jgi:hypothetical protein